MAGLTYNGSEFNYELKPCNLNKDVSGECNVFDGTNFIFPIDNSKIISHVGTVKLQITFNEANTTIYYTTDGTTPTISSDTVTADSEINIAFPVNDDPARNYKNSVPFKFIYVNNQSIKFPSGPSDFYELTISFEDIVYTTFESRSATRENELDSGKFTYQADIYIYLPPGVDNFDLTGIANFATVDYPLDDTVSENIQLGQTISVHRFDLLPDWINQDNPAEFRKKIIITINESDILFTGTFFGIEHVLGYKFDFTGNEGATPWEETLRVTKTLFAEEPEPEPEPEPETDPVSTIVPPGGNFLESECITVRFDITQGPENTNVFYTENPNAINYTEYKGPFEVKETKTIYYFAESPDGTKQIKQEATFMVSPETWQNRPKLQTTIIPQDGTSFEESLTITLQSNDSCANIYYTFDKTLLDNQFSSNYLYYECLNSLTLYTESITIDETKTIFFFARNACGELEEDLHSATFTRTTVRRPSLGQLVVGTHPYCVKKENIKCSSLPCSCDDLTVDNIVIEGEGGLVFADVFSISETGVKFRTPIKSTTHNLGSNWVNAVHVDKNNNVYAGTGHPQDAAKGGLSVSYDGGSVWNTFRIVGEVDSNGDVIEEDSSGLESNNINDIKETANEIILATDKGVSISNNIGDALLTPTFVTVTSREGVAHDEVREVSIQKKKRYEPGLRSFVDQNVIWVATKEGASSSEDGGSTWNVFNTCETKDTLIDPAIKIIEPIGGDIICKSVVIKMEVSMAIECVKYVEVTFDNKTWHKAICCERNMYVYIWNTSAFFNGCYEIRARVCYLKAKNINYVRSDDCCKTLTRDIETEQLTQESNVIKVILANSINQKILQINFLDVYNGSCISGVYPLRVEILTNQVLHAERLNDKVKIIYNSQEYEMARISEGKRSIKSTIDTDCSLPFDVQQELCKEENQQEVNSYIYEYFLDTLCINDCETINVNVIVQNVNDSLSLKIFNPFPFIGKIIYDGLYVWAMVSSINANFYGVSKSIDQGTSWTNYEFPGVQDLLVVPTLVNFPKSVWLATSGNGVYYTTNNGGNWHNINQAENNIDDDIFALGYKTNNVWLGSSSNGLYQLTISSFNIAHFTTVHGLDSNNITALKGDLLENIMWVGTDVSLHKFNITDGTISTSVLNEQINVIHSARQGIWVGTNNGLYFSSDSGSTWQNFTIDEGLSHNTILAIQEYNGCLYVGTMNGLNFTNDPYGQIEDNCTCIKWTIIRTDGIYKMRERTLEKISDGCTGLKSNEIYSINTFSIC